MTGGNPSPLFNPTLGDADPQLVPVLIAVQEAALTFSGQVTRPFWTNAPSPYSIDRPATIPAVDICNHIHDIRGIQTAFFLQNTERKTPHYVVYRDGAIFQHADVTKAANYITQFTRTPAFGQGYGSPNNYSIHILYEGFYLGDMGNGYGCLTTRQFYSAIQLQRWLVQQLPTIKFMTSHKLFDPVSYPNDPGVLFPMTLMATTVELTIQTV